MPVHAEENSNVDLLEQQAWRAAVESVSDSVVQIRLVGGLDRVGKTLLAGGPTTGLIVSEDGYLVSSAFNFAGQPTSILVRLASGQQLPAKIVARDKSRMLVLLKVEADSPLPVPEAAPENQIRVGQWSIALGRTFRSERVDVSVGIISALNRMYGRVLQTDASISAANYGGPLIDIHGRVLGVLVPMAPQAAGPASDSEVAGAEFYDSGIGFAVPLKHVLDILPQWKRGEDLLPGKLGVGLAQGARGSYGASKNHCRLAQFASRDGRLESRRLGRCHRRPRRSNPSTVTISDYPALRRRSSERHDFARRQKTGNPLDSHWGISTLPTRLPRYFSFSDSRDGGISRHFD